MYITLPHTHLDGLAAGALGEAEANAVVQQLPAGMQVVVDGNAAHHEGAQVV